MLGYFRTEHVSEGLLLAERGPAQHAQELRSGGARCRILGSEHGSDCGGRATPTSWAGQPCTSVRAPTPVPVENCF